MTIGSWNPDTQQTEVESDIDAEALQRFLTLAMAGDIDTLDQKLSDIDKAQHAMMLASHEQWENAVGDMDERQLIALMRFFTVAEMQLENWSAGLDSPVIKLNKILRQRGGKLDKDMLLWIRKNSTNRYIPNGAVL